MVETDKYYEVESGVGGNLLPGLGKGIRAPIHIISVGEVNVSFYINNEGDERVKRAPIELLEGLILREITADEYSGY